MATFILSTCGTSVITNGVQSDLRQTIIKYTNKSDWSEIPEEIAKKTLNTIFKSVKKNCSPLVIMTSEK